MYVEEGERRPVNLVENFLLIAMEMHQQREVSMNGRPIHHKEKQI